VELEIWMVDIHMILLCERINFYVFRCSTTLTIIWCIVFLIDVGPYLLNPFITLLLVDYLLS
jgi:hypothetical protein